jgi:orotate phosphoribosyltransferase
MTNDDVLGTFAGSGALLEGHFLLSSGLHSPRYLQCALVLQHPSLAERLSSELAGKLSELAGGRIDLVIAPALGGVIVGYEVGRALGVRALFTERQDGAMTLRRGFSIEAGERCLVVEDVITTGGSTREVMGVVTSLGGQVAAVGSLIDRSGGSVDLGVPRCALAVLEVPTWSPADCPLCAAGTVAIKPGSRPGSRK